MKTIIAFVLLLFTILMLVMPLNAWAAIAIPSTSNQPIHLIRPGEGKRFQVEGDFITFKTLNEDTPGEVSVIEITAARNRDHLCTNTRQKFFTSSMENLSFMALHQKKQL